MKAALVGYPGVGKSTLFDALTGGAPSGRSRDPGKPRTGTMLVHDARLEHLRDLHRPRRYQPARLDITDFPGLAKATSRAKSELLEGLRRAELLVLVVGVFEGCPAALESDGTKAADQLLGLREELVFADLELAEKRVTRLEAMRKKGAIGDREKRELELMHLVTGALENDGSTLGLALDGPDRGLVEPLGLLTRKPSFVVVNTTEDSGKDPVGIQGEEALVLCATLEAELAGIENPLERAAFLEDFGLEEAVTRRVARRAFAAADLISFFTTGSDEVRAWPIRRGSTAVQAAGKIHSDLARGFIRAEVVLYDQVSSCGTLEEYNEFAKARLEGRDWVVEDGAVLSIRFSV